MPIVTLVYALANVSYLVVLTPDELVSSSAVVVVSSSLRQKHANVQMYLKTLYQQTFGERVYGSFTWIVQILVALSSLGALHCCIFYSSRIFFVGARNGHLPGALALINLENLTPMPAIIFIVYRTMYPLTISYRRN